MQQPRRIGATPDSFTEPQELRSLEAASLEELMGLFSAALADESATARAIERFHCGGAAPAGFAVLREQLQRATRWTQAVDAAIARQYRAHLP